MSAVRREDIDPQLTELQAPASRRHSRSQASFQAPASRCQAEDVTPEGDLSIGRRLGSWKSALSFAFAIGVLALVVLKGGIDPAAMWHRLRTLNLGLFLSAFVAFYLTFPLRGYRWKQLLQNVYADDRDGTVERMPLRGVTEIVYISFFVNCVVPAKLGDLYRAYLAKLWVGVSWTRTIGTVMAERLADILVLSPLLALTGLIIFHGRLGRISIILGLGIGFALAGMIGLFLMKTLGHRIRELVPARFVDRYVAFEEGTLGSFRRIPLLVGLTAGIWLLEGTRLQLVFASLGVHTHISGIPFVPVLFFALGAAVLTTIPFSPGGLGLVEVGLGSLMIYLGIPKVDAAAVVLVDRILTYYSIAFFGFLVYLLSQRSHHRQPAKPRSSPRRLAVPRESAEITPA